jgi:hypothetical protein
MSGPRHIRDYADAVNTLVFVVFLSGVVIGILFGCVGSFVWCLIHS